MVDRRRGRGVSARDAEQVQRRAADPRSSASVTANAGSGKTKTLVDRVARLLMEEVEPERILCITYTKAAAAEMQNRLFKRLGDWSVLQDEALRKDLADLQGVPAAAFDNNELSIARKLFARALEAPGGLKIQTIHAFCEKLLRRFPIEAAVSPGFKVMDDRDGAEIVAQAQTRVAEMAMLREGPVADAYARLSIALDFGAFQDMFADFEARRAEIAAYVARCDGAVEADVWRRCGFDGPAPVDDLLANAVIDPDLWREAAGALAAGGANDAKLAEKLLKAAASGELADAFAALFTEGGEGTPITQVGKTKAFAAREDLRSALLDDQARLEEARERLRAARIAEDTVHALVLAEAYVNAYAGAKQACGALDFADLIARTCELLTVRADAAWVLYKLDGGIDHILLDEAQDTAPEQWRIVRALTGEFFAGADAEPDRPLERTLFIVGDEKQSIYSFQGADPDQLRLQTAMYHELIQGFGGRSERLSLLTSFRSTRQVLAFVDATFAARDLWPGVPPPAGEEVVRHLVHHDHPGCVDLWELEQERPAAERDAWTRPLDEESDLGANRRLAEKIAAEIKALVGRGDRVFDKDAKAWRGAHYGDVLILVRRRKALFEEILRALKRRDVPVAGADRLSLSAHIAFDDFLALARFVQHPDDDLTLAALLKSPLLGVDEDGLFCLAYGRQTSLWRTLQARGDEDPSWRFGLATLRRSLAEAPARRPFDFFSRVLGWAGPKGRSVRAEILTRLGPEAEEVLDEFLAQVLSAERAGISDLERLAADFAGLDITVKRELESARHQVRVMTVHGAKGLEAPIVFLPETTLTRGARGPCLLATEDGGFLWAPTKARDCDASGAARQRLADKDEQETQRLFYVALTRARDRLVLCGRRNATGKRENAKDWYAAAEAALASGALAGEVRELDGGTRRFGPDPEPTTAWTPDEGPAAALPAWALARPAAEAVPRTVSPSRLGDEEPDLGPAPSPLARTGGLGRYRRGDLIHRLLQLLPDIAPPEREAAALRLLARERDLTDAQSEEMAAAALGVLNDQQFAAVFGSGSRAEVAVAGLAPGVGPISGRVDRLVVEPDRVLVVDFKTNRPAPGRIEDADPAYLAQMAVYVAVLKTIFPGRRVEAALVWTDGPRLMPAPENLTVEALSRLGRSVDT
jgi:ATP-dependent helicase/nuclease subunit A